MNDIIDFVHKAIKKNYRLDVSDDNIYIFNKNNDAINFSAIYEYRSFGDFSSNENITRILICNSYGGRIQITPSSKDVAKFKLLCEEAKEYSEETLINKFNSFFSEDEITINDLDSEDE
jgi:hypothetical protein